MEPKLTTLDAMGVGRKGSKALIGVYYILIVVFSMTLSFVCKRSIHAGGNIAKGLSSRRTFKFSSSWKYGTEGNGHFSSSSAGSNFDAALLSLSKYEISVAYQPKEREDSNMFNVKKNPSPAQISPTGEDNLFVSNASKDGFVALGVADGVGGWSEAGYDSSAISRELCASLHTRFEQTQDTASCTPKELLEQAFSDVLKSPKVEIGGTTACLGILTPDYQIKVANLGDSWCGHFRDYKLINQTKFQTHNFNTPFQLAKIPSQIVRQAELQGRKYIIDSPSFADEYTWSLEKNDIIMFATDGVTDNIVTEDIERFLREKFDSKTPPGLDRIADSFVKEVVKVSKDSMFPSAFAQELSELTGQKYLGGKEDDITIALIKVT